MMRSSAHLSGTAGQRVNAPVIAARQEPRHRETGYEYTFVSGRSERSEPDHDIEDGFVIERWDGARLGGLVEENTPICEYNGRGRNERRFNTETQASAFMAKYEKMILAGEPPVDKHGSAIVWVFVPR